MLCKNFDDGEEEAALPISTSLRVLLHDAAGGRRPSVSLVSYLDLKSQHPWLDTAGEPIANNRASQSGLVAKLISTSAEDNSGYRPVLDGHANPAVGAPDGFFVQRWLPFNDWWHTPVFLDADETGFSREDLVRAVANQDGGAHWDEEIPVNYDRLANKGSLGHVFYTQNASIRDADPVPSAIRQIAHEVFRTIEPSRPDVLPNSRAVSDPSVKGSGLLVSGEALTVETSEQFFARTKLPREPKAG